MSNNTTITGNMGHEANLKFTPSGRAVLGFSLADTPRRKNGLGEWEDAGETLWVDVSIWGEEAEDLAERMAGYKGRVTVTGRLGVRSYEAKDGTERQVVTLNADSVAMHARRKSSGASQQWGASARVGAPKDRPVDDPWAVEYSKEGVQPAVVRPMTEPPW